MTSNWLYFAEFTVLWDWSPKTNGKSGNPVFNVWKVKMIFGLNKYLQVKVLTNWLLFICHTIYIHDDDSAYNWQALYWKHGFILYILVASFSSQLYLFFLHHHLSDFVVGGLTLRPCWWHEDAANEFVGPWPAVKRLVESWVSLQ